MSNLQSLFLVSDLLTCQSSQNWLVYFILCKNGSLYCGITNHAQRRFRQHQQGTGARYTKIYGALEMRVVYCCLSRSEALKIEYFLKKCKRDIKLSLWHKAKPICL